MKIGSPKLIAKRSDEIVSAVEKLYQTRSFKDITFKEIADLTTFTRTSIYNYFQTKEEIFLALTQLEYERWIADLETVIRAHNTLSKDKVAHHLARSLEKRTQLLKLITMNLFDMEANSRLEVLTEFKIAYGNSIKTVKKLLTKFCPDMTPKQISDFLYALFPFIYGIYPYVFVTDKQKKAMQQAKTGFTYHSVYELAYPCIKKLLS